MQVAPNSKPKPSPLSSALAEHSGNPELLLEALFDDALVELDDEEVLPRYWQLVLFSQPQPSPLLIAAALHDGTWLPELEEDEALELEPADSTHDRPFSKPQPSPLRTAEEEQVGCLLDD